MFVWLVPVVKLRQEFCCLKYKPSQRMFLQLSISFVTYEWAQYAKMTESFAFLQHPKIVLDFVSRVFVLDKVNFVPASSNVCEQGRSPP